jgi:hypothetical protein
MALAVRPRGLVPLRNPSLTVGALIGAPSVSEWVSIPRTVPRGLSTRYDLWHTS